MMYFIMCGAALCVYTINIFYAAKDGNFHSVMGWISALVLLSQIVAERYYALPH